MTETYQIKDHFHELEKYQHWARLTRAYQDWIEEEDLYYLKPNIKKFKRWMLHRWGILIGLDGDMYGPEFRIVHSQRYLLFRLKYS